jgi:hypothetical protein
MISLIIIKYMANRVSRYS